MDNEALLGQGADDTGAGNPNDPPIQPAGDPPVGDQPAGDASEGAEPKVGEGEPVVPEKYEFKAPEGEVLNPEILSEFEGVAKELKLTQESANKLFDMGLKLRDGWQREAIQKHADMVSEWTKQTKADAEFGGEKFTASKVLANEAFTDVDITPPDFAELLRAYGLTNHPAVFRHFVRLGARIKPDGVVTGVPPQGPGDAAKTLFPSMN